MMKAHTGNGSRVARFCEVRGWSGTCLRQNLIRKHILSDICVLRKAHSWNFFSAIKDDFKLPLPCRTIHGIIKSFDTGFQLSV
jgi:hypothetical protein